MASIGHVVVGLALGRVHETRGAKGAAFAMFGLAGLAVLPDCDVVGVALGLDDDCMWGHRGWTHSLVFAAAVALLVGLVARKLGRDARVAVLLAFMAVASHGFLDALTMDSRGVPFLWPLSEHRFAFPWRPIPVAPTGLAFASGRGLAVGLIEAIYMAPLLLYLWLAESRGVPVFSRIRGALPRLALVVALVLSSVTLTPALLRNSRLVTQLGRVGHRSIVATGGIPTVRRP